MSKLQKGRTEPTGAPLDAAPHASPEHSWEENAETISTLQMLDRVKIELATQGSAPSMASLRRRIVEMEEMQDQARAAVEKLTETVEKLRAPALRFFRGFFAGSALGVLRSSNGFATASPYLARPFSTRRYMATPVSSAVGQPLNPRQSSHSQIMQRARRRDFPFLTTASSSGRPSGNANISFSGLIEPESRSARSVNQH